MRLKHSKGTLIEVKAHINAEGEYEILVQDNGVGIPTLDEPEGHYGLNIMTERSRPIKMPNLRFQKGSKVVRWLKLHSLTHFFKES